jgi:hypothetical protein
MRRNEFLIAKMHKRYANTGLPRRNLQSRVQQLHFTVADGSVLAFYETVLEKPAGYSVKYRALTACGWVEKTFFVAGTKGMTEERAREAARVAAREWSAGLALGDMA